LDCGAIPPLLFLLLRYQKTKAVVKHRTPKKEMPQFGVRRFTSAFVSSL
jgi:hypothetical protein